MQAFSTRQLKSNPSAVLRAAEADAMALVTSHQQPADLVVALDRLGLPNTEAVRSGLALSLFRSGSISVASAAEVAGLPLPRFLEILRGAPDRPCPDRLAGSSAWGVRCGVADPGRREQQHRPGPAPAGLRRTGARDHG